MNQQTGQKDPLVNYWIKLIWLRQITLTKNINAEY